MGILIQGKEIAAKLTVQLAQRVENYILEGRKRPSLHVILVGDDPASQVYVGHKEKACARVGITSYTHRLAAETSQQELENLVEKLRLDTDVDGILIQLPLPQGLDSSSAIDKIGPDKDVDGLTIYNQGALALGSPYRVPCTPKGILCLLREACVSLEGKHAVVVGRSKLVGLPVARLLSLANATVTLVHSKTKCPQEICCQADVLVVAAGQPEMVRCDWIKEGAVVIDVGIHRKADGSLTGDVDPQAAQNVAHMYTPVPGGVGPMTIFSLLENTVEAAYGVSFG
ncbi:MAG: bifunctional methylenetetrahydrofolate dehydrogenase/methenyltetrahydrofolate cyclohydrolase FolD [Zetaproteobacteria bacterium]|nr:bifunctional methylenetetrahydrofolate dehydrogenase/methenyltetrahydrofolate cyclohydrolase FolD [Zetaproteobacteria bacterium]